ncbi:metal-dependent hydrolase [Panacibacter ginsenosidivorans]|uniref:Metal-dependent hydrolase n=1 Tax=Panacibacter ginsenosidivorans TaxID=1813871 RepID=A0A5B8V4Y0_9BACT|nr:metal-dependent hydrolase [Panacibacter ginsenosidivorans]QEC66249.1 metal-dependent hydrolase [Panacibacter ginsenosidivorans]
MDSITHIALGACMGEAFAGKKLGKKAMLWGALAQSIPDIDFTASLWMDTSSGLLAHRGFTHSFLFCALITPLLALLAERLHRPHNISLRKWLLFFGAVIFIHIFIDAFNNYGVGWFEPFSKERISFNAIYVADPFFSVWSGVACIALIWLKRNNPLRKRWWQAGIGFSAVYLLYCIFNKVQINSDVKEIFKTQNITYTRYFTTPAPLQNWLWYVVAGDDKGYYVGFRSLFDSRKAINFQYFLRNDTLLKSIEDHEDLQKLIRFSQQFYTVEQWKDTLVFNDLRFGQIIGWQNPHAKFVFYYYLQHPEDNRLVVQRGRFQGWNDKTLISLLQRIRGN